MSEPSAVQLRGHCQCCCRIQAVTNGYLAKHGYEVKNRGLGGWFQGVCSGNQHRPVEVERRVLDEVVKAIYSDIAQLRAWADRYEQGVAHPDTCVTNRFDPVTRKTLRKPWNEASAYEQQYAIKVEVARLRSRADGGQAQAQMMTRVADEHHGKPLMQVAKDAGPAPIPLGQWRITQRFGPVQAREVARGQVYYKDPKGFRRHMSTRAWRGLPESALPEDAPAPLDPDTAAELDQPTRPRERG